MKRVNFLSFIVIVLALLTFSTSCKKEQLMDCTGSVGVFKDFTGLDGCGVLIELDDGTILEDTGLRLWDVEVDGSTKYCISYEETGGASVCMVGKLVEVVNVEEL